MWVASNDYFAAQMQEAAELWDKALQKQMIWAYLMAPIYATEDRQQLFDLLAQMVFGHSLLQVTTLVRMYENNGTSNLCLNSARMMRLGPHTTGMVFKCEGKQEEGRKVEGPSEWSRGGGNDACLSTLLLTMLARVSFVALADLLSLSLSVPLSLQLPLPRGT